MIFAGIDPGLSGYLATFRKADGGQVVTFSPVPTLEGGRSAGKARRRYDRPGILELLRQLGASAGCAESAFVVIERQQAMGRGSTATAFATGYGYGLWTMALAASGIPYLEVRPSDWKRTMGVTGQGSDQAARRRDSKRRCVELAQSLYPRAELIPAGCRVPNADRAEALLLAEYGRRIRDPVGHLRPR